MSCAVCQTDPDLKEAFGCEAPTQHPAWVNELDEEEYYTCPLQMIPVEVYDWYRTHVYRETYGVAPPPDRVAARDVDALLCYMRETRRWETRRADSARNRREETDKATLDAVKRSVHQRNGGGDVG
jgi:hypothetical protein